MPSRTITSREFDRDPGAAQRAAEQGPVIVTRHGRPSHVLLSFADYERLASSRDIAALLSLPDGAEDEELEIPPRRDRGRPADLD